MQGSTCWGVGAREVHCSESLLVQLERLRQICVQLPWSFQTICIAPALMQLSPRLVPHHLKQLVLQACLQSLCR